MDSRRMRVLFRWRWRHMEQAERHRLGGELMLWGASVGGAGTLWDMLYSQICYQSQDNARRFIDALFAGTPTADVIMLRLQVGRLAATRG